MALRRSASHAVKWGWYCNAGLLDALNNETPPCEPAMSPTNKLHAAYEPISEAELLADGLIEPVNPPTSCAAINLSLLSPPWCSSADGRSTVNITSFEVHCKSFKTTSGAFRCLRCSCRDVLGSSMAY